MMFYIDKTLLRFSLSEKIIIQCVYFRVIEVQGKKNTENKI